MITQPPIIENYRFGKIEISGKIYTKDVIIFPDHVMANWWRKKGHKLSVKDLRGVLDAQPDVLVIGRGAVKRMKVPHSVREHVEAQGIEVIAQGTEEACQTYNRLREEKSVIAALHLAC